MLRLLVNAELPAESPHANRSSPPEIEFQPLMHPPPSSDSRRAVWQRSAISGVAALALFGGLSSAFGQSIPAKRVDPFEETNHRIEVARRGSSIEATIRRTFRNRSTQEQRLRLYVSLPEQAAVTSFRTKPSDRWLTGRLLEDREASRRFSALQVRPTSAPGAEPSAVPLPLGPWADPPALFFQAGWNQSGFVVPRVRPGASVELEYKTLGPRCFRAGRTYWLLPKKSTLFAARAPTVVSLGTNRPLDRVESLPKSVAKLPQSGCGGQRHDGPVYQLPPLKRKGVTARWASSLVGTNQMIARLEFEIHTELQPPPRRPSVVFVLDASYSHEDPKLKHQLAFVKALAPLYVDGVFQIVTFNRFARALLPRFVTASQLAPALAKLPAKSFSSANGSDLTAGIAEAATALAASSARGRGDQRIIVFTDGAMQAAFRADDAITALGSARGSAVLHVVQGNHISHRIWHGGQFDRVDPLATITGGTSISFSGIQAKSSEHTRLLSHLVNPNRIDGLMMEAPVQFNRAEWGVNNDFVQDRPRATGEGFGQTMLLTSEKPIPSAQRVRLSGRIWGRAWQLDVPSPRQFKDQIGALAVGDNTTQRLAAADLLDWAMKARVVSKATSILVPVKRPVAVAETHRRLGRSHRARAPRAYYFGTNVVRPERTHAWHQKHLVYLTEQLETHLKTCAPNSLESDAAVALETTSYEIVAVDVHADDPRTASCIEDWAWGFGLGKSFMFDSRFFVKVKR